ncbi:cytochrome P450 [Amylibacter sp. SFDW26]|uniref:cytochrome P450 n=1 Tax=Amylibacter sp. SFDW26 TaxID=2652722 RepID=UPI001261B54A|nr:cytochrome P450 [Amylibacter sp. SFDW26]KAB7616047.1 cytochrome P450 [Amylibacter sp. SFDW26]
MSKDFIPPKPKNRPDKVTMLQHMRLFRKDIFESQPQKLYRAWMAEFRLPFFKSYFVNDPKLVDHVLKKDPDSFPKSEIIKGALYSLLGDGVFVSNGELWKRQRRIIDPAFEGGRLRDVFPSMMAAGSDAVERLKKLSDQPSIEIEEQASQLAADIIFRTLFSIPITDDDAKQIFNKFKEYQRTQPLMTVASFFKIPNWIPKLQRSSTKRTSADIRKLLTRLTNDRFEQIKAGTAPDDLATKIMTTCDPVTGDSFTPSEMVDQVAIFFLAGHETSASALAWTLYLLAVDQETQDRVAAEVTALDELSFANLSKLPFTRDVFREALRLYPPVPMMVRENIKPEIFRDRKIKVGSQIVLSPWHLQRHERFWDRPDEFDPDRWKKEATKKSAREAYMPFSAGQRVCTGAGFAMIEGVLMITMLIQAFKIETVGIVPRPVAHLTVRAESGIHLKLTSRGIDTSAKQKS